MFKVSSESDCNGDAELGPLNRSCAEIIVVLHGETAWNADGRIQVCGNAYVSYVIRLVYALIDSFFTFLNFKSLISGNQ